MDYSLYGMKGLGKARINALIKANISSIKDLVNYLPIGYRDMTKLTPLSMVKAGMETAFSGIVSGTVTVFRKGSLHITSAYIDDGTDRLAVVWYNQPWLRDQLYEGRKLSLYGRIESSRGKIQASCPALEPPGRIIPVYKPLSGIPGKTLAQIIEHAAIIVDCQWADELPIGFKTKYGLCERNYAMLNVHNPSSPEALQTARRRLVFEDLLLYQAALYLMRGHSASGVSIDVPLGRIDEFYAALPYKPTNAQLKVMTEIISDISSNAPMARLIQGDVGSGKTMLAFAALFLGAKAGWQGALMAPTEILAFQHYEGAVRLLGSLGITCGLLTGSIGSKARKEAKFQIASGKWQVVIGTHALISEDIEYKNLGLVITDEQHRFGVRQRSLLGNKGDSPNVLVMSATPIPRTLSLILYGDLDISIVDELPPGRTPVKTHIVPESKREGMYSFIRDQVAQGRQAYFVCPLVEESEAVDAVSAQDVFNKLALEKLCGLTIGLVHGRMKATEKEDMLKKFNSGEIDVLVSTTVIEVGVNVPNASVMVIENAERFGLAQLHQLRGRVGRGAAISYCFLLANENETLSLLTRTNDGFIIAQKDMEMRGPGELFGTRQHGLPEMSAGALIADTEILKETHDAMRQMVKEQDSKELQAEAQIILDLAAKTFAHRLNDIGLN